uniref:Uncharacterized protein n=1 Tax=Leersia perrieri TaxID=77586 RepID=A0A0D9Y1A5_9ORYZ
MNGGKKFGGGRPPMGTPSLAWSSVVVVVSLLAGTSIVHNIYKPDMTIPPVESTGTTRFGKNESKVQKHAANSLKPRVWSNYWNY